MGMINKILGRSDINMIIGMQEADALAHLKNINVKMRVISRNGNSIMINNKIDMNRVNVFVVGDFVTNISNMG
jgi:hypothetical protein